MSKALKRQAKIAGSQLIETQLPRIATDAGTQGKATPQGNRPASIPAFAPPGGVPRQDLKPLSVTPFSLSGLKAGWE